MTVLDVSEAVAEIRDIARSHDDEIAHSREDDLYQRVLAAIAAGAPDPKALAREALITKIIDFARWCA